MYVPTRGSSVASGSLRLGFVLVMTVCVQCTVSVLNETLEANTSRHSRWRSLDRLAIDEHWAGTFAALSHDDKERTVTLDLIGEDTACPQPVVRARLSGPALVLLSWTRYENQLVGRYDAPISGKYFIEVIVLASDLQDSSLQVSLSNCSTAVVGIGQWPAGWPENHPMSFEEYEANMRRYLAEFVRHTKDDKTMRSRVLTSSSSDMHVCTKRRHESQVFLFNGHITFLYSSR